jgi:hypothetical protein
VCTISGYRQYLVSEQAFHGPKLVGTVIGKAEKEHGVLKGYVAMLAVETTYRRCNIGNVDSPLMLHV